MKKYKIKINKMQPQTKINKWKIMIQIKFNNKKKHKQFKNKIYKTTMKKKIQ